MHLKDAEPDCAIDVLAPAWTAALIDRMPQVNQLVEAAFEHGKLGLAERWSLAKQLREHNYTHAIILPNSLKSALVAWWAKIPTRSGFVGEQRWGMVNDIRRLDKARLPMTVQRFIALGLPQHAPPLAIQKVAKPSLQVDQSDVQTQLATHQLDLTKSVLVLCPGAEFGPSKQWPVEHYATLAAHYLAEGWHVWLMGSDKDIAACQQINQLNEQRCVVLAGRTSLPQAIDLMSCASLVCSNDSGLMHIAAALQIPLVAIYGSTDPGHTPPLSANHKIARLGLDCSPCFERECPLKHLNCLTELAPTMVIKQCESLL